MLLTESQEGRYLACKNNCPCAPVIPRVPLETKAKLEVTMEKRAVETKKRKQQIAGVAFCSINVTFWLLHVLD